MERFSRVAAKTNRFTGYVTLPAMGFLIVMATPIFHLLFGEKWDASIILFQLLLFRGVFTVLTSLYNNYILALGKAKLIVYMEMLRDGVALAALIVTLPFIGLSRADDVVYGIEILLWGQVAASVITWIVTLIVAAPMSGRPYRQYLTDYLPYVVETAAVMAVLSAISIVIEEPLWLLVAQACCAVALYVGINYLVGSTIQRDAMAYVCRRFKSGKTSV